MKCAFSSCRVGAQIPHTLHLNVHGSLALHMVIVLVLNTPLVGFVLSVLASNLSSSLVSVSSWSSPFGVGLVASSHLVFDWVIIASVNTVFIPGVSSGITGVSGSFVASGSSFFSVLVSPVCGDFQIGSVAAGNEPSPCHLVCLFALLFSIIRCVAILLADG